jgi:hypothetical protein
VFTAPLEQYCFVRREVIAAQENNCNEWSGSETVCNCCAASPPRVRTTVGAKEHEPFSLACAEAKGEGGCDLCWCVRFLRVSKQHKPSERWPLPALARGAAGGRIAGEPNSASGGFFLFGLVCSLKKKTKQLAMN